MSSPSLPSPPAKSNTFLDAVPPELWIQIFKNALNRVTPPSTAVTQRPRSIMDGVESVEASLGIANNDPTHLSHVCGSWRSIVVNVPELWTRIVIHGPDQPPAPKVATWLKRSRHLAVTLEMACGGFEHGSVKASGLTRADVSNLRPVVQQGGRVETARIHAPVEYAPFFASVAERFINLQHADIHFFEDLDRPEAYEVGRNSDLPAVLFASSQAEDAWEALTTAATTSIIRWTRQRMESDLETPAVHAAMAAAAVAGVGGGFARLGIQHPLQGLYTAVRSLDLSYGIGAKQGTAFNQEQWEDVLEALEVWIWLEELEIELRFEDGAPLPARVIELPWLRRLVVRGPGNGRETAACLENLTLKKLEEMEIWHGDMTESRAVSAPNVVVRVVPEVLSEMLDRSGCTLRSLVYVDERLTSVETLSLVSMEGLQDLRRFYLHGEVDSAFLAMLTSRDSGPGMMPELEELGITMCFGLDGEVWRAVELRRRAGLLRKVTVRYSNLDEHQFEVGKMKEEARFKEDFELCVIGSSEI